MKSNLLGLLLFWKKEVIELAGRFLLLVHSHMTVHVIKSYVWDSNWESHMKPFSHRVDA